MKTLIINIKQLVQVEEEPRKWVAGADMAKLGIIDDAYLLINEDKIEAFGKMNELNQDAIYEGTDTVKEIDAKGRLVLPAYCDSHTHLVYAGSREIEYIDKIKGLSALWLKTINRTTSFQIAISVIILILFSKGIYIP